MHAMQLTPEQEKLFEKRRIDAQVFAINLGLGEQPGLVIGLDLQNLTALLAAFSVFAAEADKNLDETTPPAPGPASGTAPEVPPPSTEGLLDLRATTLYNAYCESTGYRSVITGDALPLFPNTSEAVQNAWRAAAHSTFVHPAFGRR